MSTGISSEVLNIRDEQANRIPNKINEPVKLSEPAKGANRANVVDLSNSKPSTSNQNGLKGKQIRVNRRL